MGGVWDWECSTIVPRIAGGSTLIVLGLYLLASTIRLFAVFGKGTLAPWEPPKRLVVAGIYGHLQRMIRRAMSNMNRHKGEVAVGVITCWAAPVPVTLLIISACYVCNLIILGANFLGASLQANIKNEFTRPAITITLLFLRAV